MCSIYLKHNSLDNEISSPGCDNGAKLSLLMKSSYQFKHRYYLVCDGVARGINVLNLQEWLENVVFQEC